MKRVVVLAPAKINLGLEILGRRTDGYHELRTILQAIRFTDRIVLEPAAGTEIELRVRPRRLDLGPPESNLAVRAAREFLRQRDNSSGVRITLHKRIPVGAGMGGGSADAAAVFVGLNHMLGSRLDAGRLEEIAAAIGSDVPFFIRGGTQLASGRGEILEPLPDWPGKHLVVVFPGRSLSTASVYLRLKTGLTATGPLSNFSVREMNRRFWPRHGPCLKNDLQSVVVEAEPEVVRILDLLEELGSTFARVTGSGSAVFGTAPDGASARSWVRRLQGAGLWAKHVRPARGGCSVRQS